MKREELKAMGLTDEQVESVMAKNGAEVAALNTQITTLQSEKSQLENDKKVITKEKEDKEKAIADLQKNSISKDEYDKKIKEIEKNLLTNRILSAIINEMPHREVQAPKGHHIWRVKIIGGATDVRNYCNRW